MFLAFIANVNKNVVYMKSDFTKAYEHSYKSKLVGQDERYVQAGSGNTSVKLDKTNMLVKASGFQLTEVTRETGLDISTNVVSDACRVSCSIAAGRFSFLMISSQ